MFFILILNHTILSRSKCFENLLGSCLKYFIYVKLRMVKATSKGRKVRQLNPTDCAQVFRLHAEGQSFRTIKNDNMASASCYRKMQGKRSLRTCSWILKTKKNQSLPRQSNRQRSHKNRFVTIPEIKKLLPLAHVSMSTISRRIHESGNSRSCWAALKPFLREEFIQKRLQKNK